MLQIVIKVNLTFPGPYPELLSGMENVWYLIAKVVGTLRKQHLLSRDMSTCSIARETEEDQLFSTFMQLKFNSTVS